MTRRALIPVLFAFVTLPASAQVVELSYALQPGQVLRYDCELQGQGMADAAGRRDPVTTRARFTYELSVVGLQGDKATVQCRVTDTVVAATYAGQPLPVAVNIPAVTVVMDRWGRIYSSRVQQSAMPAASPLAGLLGGQLGGPGSLDVSQLYGQLHLPGFPAGPVRVGQSWQQQAQILTADGQPIVLTWQTRLVGVVNYAGRRCAKLQTSYSFPLKLLMTAVPLDVVSVDGDVTGTSVMYFDLASRLPIAFESVQRTNMSMSAALLAGGNVTAGMVMNTTLRATLSLARSDTGQPPAGPATPALNRR